MTVLILKNIASEGPGTIKGFLEERKLPYRVVELGEGGPVPSLDGFGALVVMGGPMAIYEAEKYAFLREEFKAIEEALKKEIKIFGVCLGAQAVAHVLGARVYKGPKEEIGWLDIELTEEGLKDPAMRSLTPRLRVFHWHSDTFDLPERAVRLARSELYENQAFSYGENVYGLQFHIEVTPEMISEWFRGEPGEARMVEDTGKFHKECSRRAFDFYRGFFGSRKEGVGADKVRNTKYNHQLIKSIRRA